MPPDIDFEIDFRDADDVVDFALDLAEGRQDLHRRPADPAQLPVLDALNYDFDIVAVEPDAAQRAHLEALAELGRPTESFQGEARWRDPRTVAAIQKSGRAAQELLKDAGFGTALSDSRLPQGQYPAEDGARRHQIVMRLTNLLADSKASQLDWGEFNCMAFFKANAEAEAVQLFPSLDDPILTTNRPNDGKRKLAFAGFAIGIILLGVAVVYAL